MPENSPKIDVFAHIITPPVLSELQRALPGYLRLANFTSRPALSELPARLGIMDRYPGYRQVLTLTGPPLVSWLETEPCRVAARASNESLAEMVAAHPDHFVGFAADVNLPDVDFALEEAHRAVGELGALGVQIYTNAKGRPLDEPELLEFLETMAAEAIPVWIHPARTAASSDYPSESESRYYLWQKFGWPYETTVCMARLIYSGLFRRHPDAVVLTHHAGGVVPHLAGRLILHHESPEMRAESGVPEDFTPEEVLSSYRAFYGDTVFSGAHHPLACALDFFGPEHLLFATDMPYGAEGGEMFVRETIAAVEESDVPDALFYENAVRLLGLSAGA